MASFAPFQPVTVTTSTLSLVGGANVVHGQFQPVVISTPSLTLVGK